MGGYGAGDDIHLIIACHRHHNIRLLYSRLQEQAGIGGVALQYLDIHVLQTGTGGGVLVYDCDIVIGIELAGDEKAHLARSGDENAHIIPRITRI